MSRNTTLDILKGFCIILVVMGHFNPENAPDWYSSLIHIIYTFHMPIFMWASGFIYILTLRHESYGQFVVRKAQRLLIPYLVTSAIIVSIKYLSQTTLSVDNPVTLQSYIRILYYPEAGYFLWFIWALFLIFLIVPLLPTPQSRLIFFISSLILQISSIEFTDIFSIRQCIRFVPYFALGMVCADNINYLRYYATKISTTNIIRLSILLFCILLTIYFLFSLNALTMLILGILGTASIGLLSLAYNRANLPRGAILIISESSFIIYLFHTTFQGLVKALITKHFSPHFLPFATIVISVGLIMPILLSKYIFNRFKLTTKIFGLKKRH